MKIKLSEERRGDLLLAIKAHFVDRHGEEVGDLKAELLLDFFVEQLGPKVYNQAIQDARKFLQDKLGDLEGEFYALGDE